MEEPTLWTNNDAARFTDSEHNSYDTGIIVNISRTESDSSFHHVTPGAVVAGWVAGRPHNMRKLRMGRTAELRLKLPNSNE